MHDHTCHVLPAELVDFRRPGSSELMPLDRIDLLALIAPTNIEDDENPTIVSFSAFDSGIAAKEQNSTDVVAVPRSVHAADWGKLTTTRFGGPQAKDVTSLRMQMRSLRAAK
jgi:hypothetical protein